jgi:hypothetical protein
MTLDNESSKKEVLYRFEYYEELDDANYVDWVWLQPSEINDFKSSYTSASYRQASKEEEELYEEAYADGYGVAAMMEFESRYNGVTYRIELTEGGELDKGTKMFQCAICKGHKDFETEVAMAGDHYLTELVDDTLWHICYDCVMLANEIDGINIDIE